MNKDIKISRLEKKLGKSQEEIKKLKSELRSIKSEKRKDSIVKSKWLEKEIPKKEVSLQYETQVV